jgi:hypothetical protein
VKNINNFSFSLPFFLLYRSLSLSLLQTIIQFSLIFARTWENFLYVLPLFEAKANEMMKKAKKSFRLEIMTIVINKHSGQFYLQTV